jgi:hypothetical protein
MMDNEIFDFRALNFRAWLADISETIYKASHKDIPDLSLFDGKKIIEAQVDRFIYPELKAILEDISYECTYSLLSGETRWSWGTSFEFALSLGLLASGLSHALVLLERFQNHSCLPMRVGVSLAQLYCDAPTVKLNTDELAIAFKDDIIAVIPIQMYLVILERLKPHIASDETLKNAHLDLLNSLRLNPLRKDFTAIILAEAGIQSPEIIHILLGLIQLAGIPSKVDLRTQQGMRSLPVVAKAICENRLAFDELTRQIEEIGFRLPLYETPQFSGLQRVFAYVDPEKAPAYILHYLYFEIEQLENNHGLRAEVMQVLGSSFANSQTYGSQVKSQFSKWLSGDDVGLISATLFGLHKVNDFVEFKKQVWYLAGKEAGNKYDKNCQSSAIETLSAWELTDDITYKLCLQASKSNYLILAIAGKKAVDKIKQLRGGK